MTTFTVQFGGPKNENFVFLPLQRRMRGDFDLLRDPRADAKVKASTQPNPIPGQVLGVRDGVGFIEDPLHYEEHEALRERIEAKGFKLPKKTEQFEAIDTNTWAWYCKRAVELGLARLTAGKFPKIDESAVQKSFFVDEKPSTTDKLAAAMDRQTAVFEKLFSKLGS